MPTSDAVPEAEAGAGVREVMPCYAVYFPGGSGGTESACSAGGEFDPWVRKIPLRREWQPTSVLCLKNPKDRRAWQATVHGVTKSQTQLSD